MLGDTTVSSTVDKPNATKLPVIRAGRKLASEFKDEECYYLQAFLVQTLLIFWDMSVSPPISVSASQKSDFIDVGTRTPVSLEV